MSTLKMSVKKTTLRITVTLKHEKYYENEVCVQYQ